MKPGTWLSRIIAIAAPLAILAVLYTLVVAPLMDAYADASGRIDAANEKIAHYLAAKERQPALEKALEAEKGALPASALLPKASAAETQSALQGTLQKLLAATGVETQSSRSLPPAARGAFTVFETEVNLRASPPHLAKLFEAVEAATPVMRIEKLAMASPEGGQGPVDDEGQPILSVQVNIAGLAAAR
jgi:hypothetical protein